jgi:translation initiation factor eIF-2B subunit beta
MRQVVKRSKSRDTASLIKRVQEVGQRLTDAQPKEIAVGNIVRRVLGVIREEAEGDPDIESSSFGGESEPGTPKKPGYASPPQNELSSSVTLDGPLDEEAFQRPPLLTSHASYASSVAAPMVNSMFSLLSHPFSSSTSTPGSQSPAQRGSPHPFGSSSALNSFKDLSAEIIDGIDEIIDELDNMDDQIAAYAPDHIHSNEIILTHGSSLTVQRFLLRAASKRKFTVIHAEGYPNVHNESHATATGKHPQNGSNEETDTQRFAKPLIAAGITVIMMSDAAVFALMSRVNKVILGTHIVLANGGLIAAAGAKGIAKAAHEHRIPVVVVTGVYKLCPTFSYDFESLLQHSEPGPVLGYKEDRLLVDEAEVENPLHDYVSADLVDLFITNLGGHAPFSLSTIISDQYRSEDTDLAKME